MRRSRLCPFAPISGFDQGYRWWGTGTIVHVPVPIALFALVAATGYIVQRYTRYGRHVYAVGGNPEAARLNGLNVAAIITSVYLIVGVLSGLAGFLQSARLGAAEATAGAGYELRVIASVVIGGASLSGGRGGIGGTIIGALLIGVLTNGLVIMHVSSYWQQVVIGLIIVAAVAFDSISRSVKATARCIPCRLLNRNELLHALAREHFSRVDGALGIGGDHVHPVELAGVLPHAAECAQHLAVVTVKEPDVVVR